MDKLYNYMVYCRFTSDKESETFDYDDIWAHYYTLDEDGWISFFKYEEIPDNVTILGTTKTLICVFKVRACIVEAIQINQEEGRG